MCVVVRASAALAVLLALGFAGPAARANPIGDENAILGDAGWQSTVAPAASINGYASQTSVAPGGTLDLHVAATSGTSYRIEVHRLGYYGGAGGRRFACLPNPNCTTDKPSVPPRTPPLSPAPGTGLLDAGWSVTDTVSVPGGWVSGDYLAELILTTGADAGKSAQVPFVVRAPAASPSQVLVVVPVNTDEAYNAWGGKGLYTYNSTGQVAANHVSFNRPLDLETARNTPAPAFYSDYPLVRYLEAQGVDVSYVTDVDVDTDPSSLLSHRLVMTAGHGEYWTKAMRDGFEAARDAGVNLAFMGANTGYWQIRYEDAHRTIVAYKDKALTDDPVADKSQLTTRFSQLPPPAGPRPECKLEGVQFNNDDHNDGQDRAYGVPGSSLSDAWMAATGFNAGDTMSMLVGYEWDSVVPGCVNPAPTVLFHWAATVGTDSADATRYTAPSGARVFAAGSLQFAWGLGGHGWGLTGYAPQISPDARLQQFMRNALDDLTRPAPPTSVQTTLTGPGQVHVAFTRHADAQVSAVRVYRHTGNGSFKPTDPDVAFVCQTGGSSCALHGQPGHRQQRYAAVTVDRWGTSHPALAAPVSVPNSSPAVSVDGNRSVTALDPATFTASAQDDDGDTAAFTWSIDGVAQGGASGPSFTHTWNTPGHHRIDVAGDDGNGGTGAASIDVDVADRPPTALIDGPASFPTLRSVHFDSGASADYQGSALGRRWLLDDRPIGDAAGVDVRFTRPGTHRLVLVVDNHRGGTGTTAIALRATDRPPLVVAVVPLEVRTGRLGAFAAQALDPDGRIGGIAWDFGGARRRVVGTSFQRRVSTSSRTWVRVRPLPGGLPELILPLRIARQPRNLGVLVGGAMPAGSGATSVRVERWTCRRGRCRYVGVALKTVVTAPDGRFSWRYGAPVAGAYRFTVSSIPPRGDPRFALVVRARIEWPSG
jgi:hypothetical protein